MMRTGRFAVFAAVVLLGIATVLAYRGVTREEEARDSNGREADQVASSPIFPELATDSENPRWSRRRVTQSFDGFIEGIRPIVDFEGIEEGYFHGWLNPIRAARAGEVDDWVTREAAYEALIERREAYAYLLGVQMRDPNWKPAMVEARLSRTRHELERAFRAYYLSGR